MRLYLLEPVTASREAKGGPWDPWYDKAFGFVVRAESEAEARAMVAEGEAGDEGAEAWLNAEHSTCEELTSEGEAMIIIRDFAAA